VRGKHGASLDFNESVLGSFSHPDAQPTSSAPAASRQVSAASGAPWRDVYRTTTESLRLTICLDTGRGYAKYGLASAGTPSVLQICQPNAQCSQETLYPAAFKELGLKRAQLSQYSAIVSEPFILGSCAGNRQREMWRADVERKLLQGYGIRRLAIVDSASLCLFSHKITSGVVVNIGFGRTYIVPVLGGNIVRSAVRSLNLSGMELTQHMAVISSSSISLSTIYLSIFFLTVCESIDLSIYLSIYLYIYLLRMYTSFIDTGIVSVTCPALVARRCKFLLRRPLKKNTAPCSLTYNYPYKVIPPPPPLQVRSSVPRSLTCSQPRPSDIWREFESRV